MLVVYYSNLMERLADRLARVVAVPGDDPFAPDLVVVEGRGLERWVSLEIARRHGVSANLRFSLPGAFLWGLFRRLDPDLPERSGFEPEVLAWRVLGLLDRLPEEPCFGALRTYLAGVDAVGRWELARTVAQVFDRYLVYRPDWVLAWEEGAEGHWQAQLWRSLTAEGSGRHWLHVYDAFRRRLASEPGARALLPARACLFALPQPSPAYLEVVASLAEHMDLHLFVLNPCREYWGDVEPEARRLRLEEGGAADYLETGHPLLAAWGRHGRDFIDELQGLAAVVEEDYGEPAAQGPLGQLQGDVLDLRDRTRPDQPPLDPMGPGRDLQVHVCHSVQREVEVLQDRLLDLLATDPALTPADILVLTPDPGAYAPAFEAVFASAPAERRIPYGLTGLGGGAGSPVLGAVDVLLGLPDSRLDANQVFDLLEVRPLRRRFGLADEDLPTLAGWARASGVRWGLDGGHRAELGLPAEPGHTWRLGLDRLLLGLALSGDEVVEGVVPLPATQGQEAGLLGRLADLLERLGALRSELARDRSPRDWAGTWLGWLDGFLDPDPDEEQQLSRVRAALTRLDAETQAAAYGAPLPARVVRRYLQAAWEEEGPGRPALGGGLTFAPLGTLTGVPFPVVCLLGMDGDAFPRDEPRPDFDLTAARPRRGDRGRRAADRWAFLQALLAARRTFYVSYVGRDQRDDSPRPPSVLVSELLDYLRRAGGGTRPAVVEHPLQPFSPRCFGGGLFSYSSEMAAAGRAIAAERVSPPPFFDGVLPEPEAEWRTVTLDRLARFLSNPARALLRDRLGVWIGGGEGPLETREPFLPDRGAQAVLRTRLVEARLAGEDPERLRPVLRGEGLLPHGRVGERVFEAGLEWASAFAGRLAGVVPRPAPPALELDLHLAGFLLQGRIEDLGPEGLGGYSTGKLSVWRRLDLWVRHLALNTVAPPGVALRSRFLAEDGAVELGPIQDARDLLTDLLELYWEGLTRAVPFFPRTSYAYAHRARKGDGDPLAAARREWEGNDYRAGEGTDPHLALAWRGRDPLGEPFPALARRVWDPFLETQAGGGR